MKQLLLFATLIAFVSAPAYAQVANNKTFGDDLAFLQKHRKVVMLKSHE